MSAASDRTRVRRHPERGVYDRETIEAVLDEALICHVGFVADGQPYVIPTIHARVGDTLYLHGSPASRMLKTFAEGMDVCVTATILDGLVLARSVYHSSLNYRSVVVVGRARRVGDPAEKRAALAAVVEHVAPGRSEDARPPNDQELRGTMLVALPLTEASAKLREGPPSDDEQDLALPIWGGVLPLRLEAGEPEADEHVPQTVEAPAYVTGYSRPSAPAVASEADAVKPRKKGADTARKRGYSPGMSFVKVNGEAVELPTDRALALVVRLRASGVPHAEEAATMLEMRTGAPTLWTRAELRAVHAVVESWVRERGEEAVGDGILTLRRALTVAPV